MTDVLLLAGGLVALILGAEVLVRSSSGLASWLGVRPMMIGRATLRFDLPAMTAAALLLLVLSIDGTLVHVGPRAGADVVGAPVPA
jgi:hypothetical protein